MTFHRRMIVVGLLVTSSGSALASSASRHVDIGELQRRGEEGRGFVAHQKFSNAEDPVSPPTGLGLGEHQQRGEEGRGESRAGPPAEVSSGGWVDIGDAQRRGEEGRGEPEPVSETRHDMTARR